MLHATNPTHGYVPESLKGSMFRPEDRNEECDDRREGGGMQKERVGIFRTQVVITRIAPEEPRMAVCWAAAPSPSHCVRNRPTRLLCANVNAGLTTQKYASQNPEHRPLIFLQNVSIILHGCVRSTLYALSLCAQNHSF